MDQARKKAEKNRSQEDTLQTGYAPEDWEQQQREQGNYADDVDAEDRLSSMEEDIEREENEGGPPPSKPKS